MTATTFAPVLPSVRQRMTFEEFLARDDEHRFAEWVNGEVITLTTSYEHQLIATWLLRTLGEFVEIRDMGVIIGPPFLMRPRPDLPGREPDALFISKDRMHQLRVNWLDGPADLVVEVISPDGRHRDRNEKFVEYAQGGVREYWLIDAPRKQAEFFTLNGQGAYEPLPMGEDGIVRSSVLPGLWLDVEWLWRRPLPTMDSIRKAWGLGS